MHLHLCSHARLGKRASVMLLRLPWAERVGLLGRLRPVLLLQRCRVLLLRRRARGERVPCSGEAAATTAASAAAPRTWRPQTDAPDTALSTRYILPDTLAFGCFTVA